MTGEERYPLPRAVIFDDTAALAPGAGNSMASRLVVEAERTQRRGSTSRR
ncbi:hypothetical protein ACWGJB_23165 [Streptomyces sp. NPDC054813]